MRSHALHKRPHISKFPKVYKRALNEQATRVIGESSRAMVNDEPSIEDEATLNDNIPNREEDAGVDDMIRAFFDNTSDNEEANEVTKEEKLLRDQSKIMLYPGSKTSRLSTCLLILDLQASHGWSDNNITTFQVALYITPAR